MATGAANQNSLQGTRATPHGRLTYWHCIAGYTSAGQKGCASMFFNGGCAPSFSGVFPFINTTASSVGTTADSVGTTANSVGTTASSVGTTASSVGTTANSVGATASSVGTTANSVATTANSVGTTANSVGTSANSVGTTSNSVGASANSVGANRLVRKPVYPFLTNTYNKGNMATNGFMPRQEGERIGWLINFTAKFAKHAAMYNMAGAQVADVVAGAAYTSQWYNYRLALET